MYILTTNILNSKPQALNSFTTTTPRLFPFPQNDSRLLRAFQYSIFLMIFSFPIASCKKEISKVPNKANQNIFGKNSCLFGEWKGATKLQKISQRNSQRIEQTKKFLEVSKDSSFAWTGDSEQVLFFKLKSGNIQVKTSKKDYTISQEEQFLKIPFQEKLEIVALEKSEIEICQISPQKPNVVWIIIDSLRADVMSRPSITPNLQKIRKGSVFFQNHRTNSSWTRPSTLSFLTGLYPRDTILNFWDYLLFPEEIQRFKQTELYSLPKILSHHGYYSKMVGNNPFLSEILSIGSNTGFQHIKEYSLTDDDTPKITEDAIASLEFFQNSRLPFFLFLNFNDPHKPYSPSPEFLAMLPKELQNKGEESKYYGDVAFIDSFLGQVWQKMENLGLLENSIVIISSDHGEVMNSAHRKSPFNGVYTLYGHGQNLLEEDIRVPLLVHFPNSENLPEGIDVNIPTESVDIYPTVLEFLKLSIPENRVGKSLLELASTNAKKTEDPIWKERVYYGEGRGMRAVMQNESKLIQKTYAFHRLGPAWDGKIEPVFYQFFDLKTDPKEESPLNPLSSSFPPQFQQKFAFLQTKLEEWNPDLSHFSVKILPSLNQKSSKKIQLILEVDHGKLILKDLANFQILENEEDRRIVLEGVLSPTLTKESEKELVIAKNLKFQVQPNVFLPKLQVLVEGKEIDSRQIRLGGFGISETVCGNSCEDFLEPRGEPYFKFGKNTEVYLWRTGNFYGTVSKQEEMNAETLSALKKQGYK